MSFKVKSFNWNGQVVSEKVLDAVGDALYEAGEELLRVSNTMVPLDWGTLERSGEVDVDIHMAACSVLYDTPYAARLHEHPEYHFQRGRRGKWLETSLKKLQSHLQDHIQRSVSQALKD